MILLIELIYLKGLLIHDVCKLIDILETSFRAWPQQKVNVICCVGLMTSHSVLCNSISLNDENKWDFFPFEGMF